MMKKNCLFSCVCRDISSSEASIWPKISPIVRFLAIQLCEKFEESGTFGSRDMGLCDPQKGPFPVFAGISRVRKLRSGPKFHRLSVSWPYRAPSRNYLAKYTPFLAKYSLCYDLFAMLRAMMQIFHKEANILV